MPEVICEWCDKRVKRHSCEIEKYEHHFCSRACYSAFRRSLVKVRCKQCDKIFKRHTSHIKTDSFCSPQCYYAWKKVRPTVTCEQCNKQFEKSTYHFNHSGHHFCSLECSLAWHRNQTPIVTCEQCGKMFRKSVARINRYKHHFCSRECSQHWHSGENSPVWKDGLSREPYSLEFSNSLKEQVRKRDNYVCQLCGMMHDEHIDRYGRRLSVHHIDYNKKNCHLMNLITLCHACNSKVNNNRHFYTELFSAHNADIEQPV